MTPLSSPRIFDLFVSVVDNYGDMGMVIEYIAAFERFFPHAFAFRIWTDRPREIEHFLGNNQRTHVPVGCIDQYEITPDVHLIGLFFHAPTPREIDQSQVPIFILRFDHISFDPLWVKQHGTPHILSTQHHQIEEYIPSFLPDGGGLIPPFWNMLSKTAILDSLSLSHDFADFRWIPLFCYRESLERIDLTSVPPETLVFVFGHHQIQDAPILENRVIYLPFIPLEVFYSLYQHAPWGIVRGEVSFSQVFQMEMPFLWDMYKTQGGFPKEQSQDWITYVAHEQYSIFHAILNLQIPGKLDLGELDQFFSQNRHLFQKKETNPKNLIVEVKKKVDRFEFSI